MGSGAIRRRQKFISSPLTVTSSGRMWCSRCGRLRLNSSSSRRFFGLQLANGTLAGQHFDQHVAQRRQVTARRALAVLQHLRRGVVRRAHEAGRRRVECKGRADVDDLGGAGPLEHHVRRLDVAVHDAFAVQGRQRAQAAAHDRHGHARL